MFDDNGLFSEEEDKFKSPNNLFNDIPKNLGSVDPLQSPLNFDVPSPTSFANQAQAYRERLPGYGIETIPQERQFSHRQPHTQRAFKEYERFNESTQAIKDRYSISKNINDGYFKRRKSVFDDTIKPFYERAMGGSPSSSLSEDLVISELDDFFSQAKSDPDSERWKVASKQWQHANSNYEKANEKFRNEELIHLDRQRQELAVDPAFLRAFSKRDKNKRSSIKPNKELLGEEDYNDIFRQFNNKVTPEGGLTSFYESAAEVYGKLGKKFEQDSVIADLSDKWEELNSPEYLSQEGFNVPPSELGTLGGASIILRPNEQKKLIIDQAKDFGIDHFFINGEKVPIDEVDDTQLSDDDLKRAKALDALHKAKVTHTQALTDFFANRASMTEEELEKAEEKNRFLATMVQEKTIQLEAEGMLDEVVGRLNTNDDIGQLFSYYKSGTLSAEQAGTFKDIITKNLFESGSESDAKASFTKLAEINKEYSKIQSIKQKKGYSALAEIYKLSEEEGSDEGWIDAIGKWLGNPTAIAEVVIESLSSLLPAYVDTMAPVVGASATTGAALGSIIPGAGTLTGMGAGATWGLRMNYGVASALMEFTSKIMETMQEAGVDIHNPDQMLAAWNSPDFRKEAQELATKKSLPIFLFDTVSAGMAGKANAVLKSPSSFKKVASTKRYHKGLSKKASDEFTELKKIKNKTEEQTKRFELLKERIQGGSFFSTESALSRSLKLADRHVHRYTNPQKLKAAAVEGITQTAFGVGGEYAGQLLSREPGDPTDIHALLGEGFGELGGGGLSAAQYPIELFNLKRNPKVGGSMFQKKEDRNMVGAGFKVSNKQKAAPSEAAEIPYNGEMSSVDRAGWSHEAFTPNNATDAVAYIAEKSGEPATIESPDPDKADKVQNPKLQVLNEYIGSVMNLASAGPAGVKRGQIKIVVTDRTPEGASKGYTESDPETGDIYIYLNPKAALESNDDILGAAIHEFPHILAETYYGRPQILEWYNTLSPEQKDQALAHYVFKDSRAHQDFSTAELNDDESRLLNQAKTSLSEEERALEWFSFEYARVLLGQMNSKSKSVKTEDGSDALTALPEGEYQRIRELIDTYVAKPYSKYIGSGARRLDPENFGEGIENRVSKNTSTDPETGEAVTTTQGNYDGETLVSSEQAIKPEKMGPDEMYALILRHSQWMVSPDQQLIFQGPDKQPSMGRASGSIEDLYKQRNALLGDEQAIRRLERIAGILPKDSITLIREPIKKDSKGNITETRSVYDESGKMYKTQGTEERSAEEVEEIIEKEDAKLSKSTAIGTSREPNQIVKPQSTKDVVNFKTDEAVKAQEKLTSFVEQKKKVLAKGKPVKKGSDLDNTLTAQIESSEDYKKLKAQLDKARTKADQDTSKKSGIDFTEEMDTSEFQKSQERGKARILKELGAKNTVKEVDEKISKFIATAQKRGVAPDKILKTQGYKKLQQLRLEAKQFEDLADEKMASTVKKTKEQSRVNPGVNKGKVSISEEGVTEALITKLENRRKDFKKRYTKLDEKTEAAPEEKIKELKTLIMSPDEKFMESTEQIAQKLLDKKGRLTQEELLGAIAREYGIDQLTDVQREARSKLTGRADLNSIDEAYEVAEQSVEDLILRLDNKESDIQNEINELNTAKSAAQKRIDSEVKKNEELPDDKKQKESPTSKSRKKDIQGFNKRITELNRRKSKLQQIRETIGVGSQSSNIDWRNVEVVGTGVEGSKLPYGRLVKSETKKDKKTGKLIPVEVQSKKPGKDVVTKEVTPVNERVLTLGDLASGNFTNTFYKSGEGYSEKPLTNPVQILERLIREAFSPEGAAKWSTKVTRIRHLTPEARKKQNKTKNKKQNKDFKPTEKDYLPNAVVPETYGEFAMSLLAALASHRQGTTNFTEYGNSKKNYFESEIGSNLFGVLASRIQLLQENISKGEKSENVFNNLKKYMVAFDEQAAAESLKKADEKKLTAKIAAEDRIILNLAYTQLSIDHFGRDTSKVGENPFYSKAQVDHDSAAEAELDSNIEYMEKVLASGRVPDKVALLGEDFKKGDLFRYGNEIRKATKDFLLVDTINNPDVLNQVSEHVPYLTEGEYQTSEISKEDRKKLTSLLESARRVRDNFNAYQMGWDQSDIMSNQPKVDEAGFPLSYKHWLFNLNEKIASEGPSTWDQPFGNFHKSQRPQKQSSALEDPIYTGTAMAKGEYAQKLAKAKKNLAKGKPEEGDLELIAKEVQRSEKETAQAFGITNRETSMSGDLAAKLAAKVAQKNNKSEINTLPTLVRQELLANPALDKQFNLAFYLRRMVLRGDQRLPESMRSITVRNEAGENKIIQLDEIIGNPEYEAIWKSQNESLKNFNFHYDNLSEKSDPINSLSRDDSDIVKEYFRKQSDKKSKGGERNVTTRLKSGDRALLKANLSLIEDTELRGEIRKVLNSNKDIVLDMGDTTPYVDNMPRYFDLNVDRSRGNMFDTDPGEKFSVPSEDSKNPHAIVEILKTPEESEQFVRDFNIAKASNNLLDFLVKNKIVKEVERLETMPVDVIEASHQEVADLIKGEREKLSEIKDMIDKFQSMTPTGAEARRKGPIDETALNALYKARDELKKSIREAEKDVESGGRTGGFNIDGYRLSMGTGKLGGNPVLSSQSPGRWNLQDKRSANKRPKRFSSNVKRDDEIQAYFNNVFLERALSEKITVQDEFDPGIQHENLSSFVVTPRKLAQFVNDNGIQNINKLAGAYSRYKAESRGGIDLLNLVPGVVDEMLNDLASINKDKIARIENLLKAYEDRPEAPIIEKHLNRLLQQEEEFKNYTMAERVMLQHMADLRSYEARGLKPKDFSKRDIDFGVEMAKQNRGKAFSVAVATNEARYEKPEVITLGKIDGEPLMAIITPAFIKEDGDVMKVTKEYYENNKTKELKETGSLITKDLEEVSDSSTVSVKEIGTRWPMAQTEKGTLLESFVYDIKILESSAELSNAHLVQVKDYYDKFNARDKKKVKDFYENYNSLNESEQGDLASKFEALRESEEGLRKLFAFDFNPSLDKARAKAAKTKGEGKNKTNLFQAKVAALTGLVKEAGGIKTPTLEDIKQAEKNIQQDADQMFSETESMSDGGRRMSEDYISDDLREEYGYADNKSIQDDLDNLYKQNPGFISGLDLEEGVQASSDFIGRDPGLLDILAEGLGRRAKAVQETVLGKREAPKKGFLKTRGEYYKRYVEQFAALEDLFPEIEKALGIPKESDAAEKLNAYSEAYATMGRTGFLMDEVNRDTIEPIKEALYDSKVDREVLGNYLIGLVAPQVNRAVARNRKAADLEALVDPKTGQDAGSGMTNAQAADMVKKAMADTNLRNFIAHKNKPIDRIFDIHKKSLDIMVESQMISKEQYDSMLKASLDENGNFRRLPYRGMWWLDNDEFANQKELDDLVGGSGRASGKGFDQPRKEGMTSASMGRQFGHWANPAGMLEHATSFNEETIIRSQRNVVARKVLDWHDQLLEAKNKDPNSYAATLYNELFTVLEDKVKLEYKSMEDTNGNVVGRVQQVITPAELNNQKSLFYARKDGQPIVIKFNLDTKAGGSLSEAVKNLKYKPLDGFLNTINSTTKFIARMLTSWNPEFWLRNPVRDTSSAYLNLGDSEIGKSVRNQVINPVKLWKQWRGIAKYENALNKTNQAPKDLIDVRKNDPINMKRLNSDPVYAYRLFAINGGKTSFYAFKSVAEMQKEMSDFNYKKSNPVQLVKKASKAVDLINTAMENGYRVRTFVEFLNKGMPIERAVREARNVTVDFNKKGVTSQGLGVFLLFANPAVQGTKRTFNAFKNRGPQGAAWAGMNILGLSIGLNYLARWLSEKDEEEDDGTTYHDNRSAVKNMTSVSIPMDIFHDGKKQGRNLDLPIDFALAPIWGLGEVIAKHVYHVGNDKYQPDLVADVMDYVKVSAMGISPVPTSLNVLPALEPVIEIVNNRNSFTGRPIYDEGSGFNKKSSPQAMSLPNTAGWAKSLSKFLNEAGGGSEHIPGNWLNVFGPLVGKRNLTTDVRQGQFNMGAGISGPVMQHIVENYLGGLGKIGSDITDLLFYPESVKSKKIPILNAIYKNETSNWQLISRYYDLSDRTRDLNAYLNSLKNTNDIAGLRAYHKKFPESRPMLSLMEKANRGLQANRRLKKKLEKNKSLSEEAKLQRGEILEQQRINIMSKIVVKAHQMGISV